MVENVWNKFSSQSRGCESCGFSRTGLGKFDQEFVEQFGDALVNVLGAVVGMKAFDDKKKLLQERFQYWDQVAFRDFLHRANDLKLGDLIDGIEVINPFNSVQIAPGSSLGQALVDSIDSNIAGLVIGLRFASFAGRGRLRTCLLNVLCYSLIGLGLPEVVQVRDGDLCKMLVFGLFKNKQGPLTQLFGGRPGQATVEGIHMCQQLDVLGGVTPGKAVIR